MAKKAQSTLINMLLSLTLIALVASLALALVNNLTKKPIEEAKIQKTKDAIAKVLSIPDPADSTKTIKIYEDYVLDSVQVVDTVKGEAVTITLPCYKALDKDGNMVGAAIESYSDAGFGGRLKAMVGFDIEGNVMGYEVLESQETPGLGAKAKDWFQRTGKGNIIGKNPGTMNFTVKKDNGEIDAITGSTITSRAFCGLVGTAYKAFLTEKGGINQ